MSEPFYYVDASVLVKQHVDERGSIWVRTTLDAQRMPMVTASRIASVEVIAAFLRRFREGSLTDVALRQILGDFRLLSEHVYQWIEVSPTLAAAAQGLTQRHPLRALDALHLASALHVANQLAAAGQAGLILLAADGRLLAAAQAEGLAVINPELVAEPPEPPEGTPAADAPDAATDATR